MRDLHVQKEQQRLHEASKDGIAWRKWGPYLEASGNGALFVKTTVLTEMPGTTSPTISPARELITGEKTDSREFPTTSNSCALR